MFPAAGGDVADALAAGALWDATWPMLVGAALFAGLWALGDPLPRVPAGDIVGAEEAAFRAARLSGSCSSASTGGSGNGRRPAWRCWRSSSFSPRQGSPVADAPASAAATKAKPPQQNQSPAQQNQSRAQQNQRPAQQKQNRARWNLGSGSRCFNSLRLISLLTLLLLALVRRRAGSTGRLGEGIAGISDYRKQLFAGRLAETRGSGRLAAPARPEGDREAGDRHPGQQQEKRRLLEPRHRRNAERHGEAEKADPERHQADAGEKCPQPQ